MKLYFYGGARMVTGSNYILETSLGKIMIDCGLFQGRREIEEKNYEPFPYKPSEIGFVLITHAHLDHLGRLPKLIKEGFNGRILATRPTIDFARLMLEDSQKIIQKKAAQKGIFPRMDIQQIDMVMEMFEAAEYDREIKLNEEVSVCFREAGHVLGSAVIECKVREQGQEKEKKIVFSGDLGTAGTPILQDPFRIKNADYVVMESTYGDRLHEARGECKNTIEDVVEETIARGGVLMIPSFALERTQQLLYHFNDLVENSRIPRTPIFVDSPLAIKLTEIYRRHSEYFDKEALSLIESGDKIFKFPDLKFTLSTNESRAINNTPAPKIIIAGSGMSQGGRIIHHELRYLSDPKNTLLFVTYQAQGTLGRKIFEGAKAIRIMGQDVAIRARIEYVGGYSSHADQKGLMDWLSSMTEADSSKKPKKVFVCHGEEDSSLGLAEKIKSDFGLAVEVPRIGDVVSLT
ncbi:MBL fold metallo-hydrolase [Patescibacteria group bacterium]|nr:MBL fold metallo-hydrolase [Patescibacteria group bacterium]MBU2579594.1 MBL fold metallo-hydrolase [Patescibacteria group bacterium]MBU4030691.1 MBL fold metallo-hydrolase [Patescibacteria group bacterium]